MVKKNTPSSNKPRPVKDLILLFSVPMGVIIFAVALVYIPRVLANPTYDFIYSHCSDYYCSTNYDVNTSGKIVDNYDKNSTKRYYDDRPRKLAYYDVSEGTSRSLTTAEAVRYTLDSSSKSPDGYTLTRDSSSSGFLFWSDSRSNGWVLEKGAFKKPLDGLNDNSYYSDNINFLGWIKNED